MLMRGHSDIMVPTGRRQGPVRDGVHVVLQDHARMPSRFFGRFTASDMAGLGAI